MRDANAGYSEQSKQKKQTTSNAGRMRDPATAVKKPPAQATTIGGGTKTVDRSKDYRTPTDTRKGDRWTKDQSESLKQGVRMTTKNQVDKVKTKDDYYPIYKKKSNEAKSFRTAFADARKAGEKVFTWNGRKYNTKVK